MVGLPPALRAPSPLPCAPAGWVGLSPGAGGFISAPLAGGRGCALCGCAIKGLPWFSSCRLLLFLGSVGHSDPNLPVGGHLWGLGQGWGGESCLLWGSVGPAACGPSMCPSAALALLPPLLLPLPSTAAGVQSDAGCVSALAAACSGPFQQPGPCPKTNHQPWIWAGPGSRACTPLGDEEGSSPGTSAPPSPTILAPHLGVVPCPGLGLPPPPSGMGNLVSGATFDCRILC